LHFFGILLTALLKFLLAFEIRGVARFHIFVHSLKPLFVLGHALSQIIFHLLFFFEDCIEVNLLDLLPLGVALLLNIDDHAVLVPNTLHVFSLDQSIVYVITPQSAKDRFHICLINTTSLVLNNLKCFNKVFVFLESIQHGLLCTSFALIRAFVLGIDRVNSDLGLFEEILEFRAVTEQISNLFVSLCHLSSDTLT